VIRRESAFREAAVSPAGALGLMQVMPATAKMMTKKLGMKRMNRKQMRQANNNIKLGAGYLRQVLNKYNGHEILATASYNAGPHRVKKWLPEDEVLPADIWIDTITFDETRKYVKAVLFYSTIFDWKLDGRVDHKLNERMKPVQPEQDMSVAVFN
ncbi:MAG TPA: lytic transglycosylase domain-containing protein, partial [Gammaproteobacteria bacterium]|nr:lytic transglycosylase domain-containing protein [Gammaproteobacteria bacterium]